jgi:signal recognition particle subunit SRP54
MFDQFLDSIRSIIDNFVNKPLPENLESSLKQLKDALIEADVDVEVANKIIEEIRNRIKQNKENIPISEKFIKATYDTFKQLLGESVQLKIQKVPFKILLVGLYGSGKTTTAGKLALYYKKRGLKPLLVGLDVHRPAAIDQLKQLAAQAGVKCIAENDIEKTLSEYKKVEKQFDVIIFDTAGRSAVDKELIDEIVYIKQKVNPDQIVLVISADIGQNAKKQVTEFHNALGITSIIITKTDTSARGGGALTAAYISGAKVIFVGEGEKLTALSEFDVDTFIKRLVGIDRFGSLIEKIKQEEIKINEESAKRILENKFTLLDFYEQFRAAGQLGASNILKTAGISTDKFKDVDKKLKDYMVIINSMTKKEIENPDIIDSSRIRRIAKGSGKSEEEVRELINLYKNTKKVMKLTSERGISRLLSKFGFKL